QLHGLAERFEISRLHSCEGLDQRVDGPLHQPHTHPFSVHLAHDRSVMGVEDRKILLRHSLWSTVANDRFLLRHRPLRGAVAINETIAAFRYSLEIFVDVVGTGRRVHPAGAVVEALVDEELSPGYRAV